MIIIIIAVFVEPYPKEEFLVIDGVVRALYTHFTTQYIFDMIQ